MSTDRLNVIGLISGGKDSFYSLLHCIEHGHKIVALANLFPAAEEGTLPIETQWINPEASLKESHGSNEGRTREETDLNSFMYQTVGHEVIPLYAAATGLPLYRRQIHGSAVRHERDYDYASIAPEHIDEGEETESMTPLLKSIMERHPEANAVCAGAILSTYQRTRVESIALRLGLTPLAYLWKYPILPPPTMPADDAQLLKDMEAVGLDARIIKVASAGLDEDHLWLKTSSFEGAEKVKRALRKFGAAQGAALGEGGEFETLVLDGPKSLFRRRICVPDNMRSIIKEGGGTAWMKIRGAYTEEKGAGEQTPKTDVRCPDLFDQRFQRILDSMVTSKPMTSSVASSDLPSPTLPSSAQDSGKLITRTFLPKTSPEDPSIRMQISNIVAQVLSFLQSRSLSTSQVSNTIILLRDMADFPAVNAGYSKLFPRANPPSRVTISCGNLLPEHTNIVLTISLPLSAIGRQGLHVQSRSYWAPANIGPYSQGIALPLSANKESDALRLVSIAGQIPLIPATMLLPESSEKSSELQITLSLQHLWRIAADLKVQFWSSAVAYFSRASSESEMQRRTTLAAHAWTEANRPSAEDDDDQAQLDPWDLKHNSAYMILGNDDDSTPHVLPNWELLPLRQQNDWESRVPPLFAVEVESLPRQAEVEWHAHVGIAGANEGSIEMFSLSTSAGAKCNAWSMLVRENDSVFLHTTVTYTAPVPEAATSTMVHLQAVYEESAQKLRLGLQSPASQTPYLVYLDAKMCETGNLLSSDRMAATTVVPCHSLWTADGTRRSALALYRRMLSTGS